MTRPHRGYASSGWRSQRWRLLAAVSMLWLFSGDAYAQGAIQSVSVSVLAGQEVIRVETSEPLQAPPAAFSIQTPARIAMDFPATVNAIGRERIELHQGNLRSVNIIEADGRTRLVVNLDRAVPYDMRIQGNVLLVTLQSAAMPAAADAATAGATTFGAGQADSGMLPVRDIDFRRGEDGTGRIVVELDNPQTGVDIRQQGRQLVVEFLRSVLPEGLRRRLDVSDFGTPVRMITATQVGDRVRLLVEPSGDWEHSAYQSDRRFVLEVRPLKPTSSSLAQGARYSGDKLSLNFQDIDVRALLQVIADFTDFNIITTDAVQGNLTLRLKDVPWDQALDIILQAKNLGMTKIGNVIRVAPKKDLDAEALAQRELDKKLEELEPLRTEVFRLNFAKAKEIADVLNQRMTGGAANDSGTNRLLSARGSALADERTNQVFVTDVAARLQAVREYIQRVDTPKKQVMIQARIVEAREGFSRSLGVRLGGADLRTIRGGNAGYVVDGRTRLAWGGSYDAITSTTGQTDNLMTNANTTFVNLPARSDTVQDIPRLALSLFSPAANRFLNLELSALESDNRGRVISSPRVVTGDLSKSRIKQGDQLKLILPGGTDAAPRVETVDANLQLDVEPQITPSGKILLKLSITKNRVLSLTAAGASLAVKEVSTEVMVDNGGTVMIGGIFEQEETQGVDKVPVLGDVPVLGNLFKTRNNNAAKTETLIFITPVILEDGAAAL